MNKPTYIRKSARATFRPRFEVLETRLTPSAYTVSSLADSGEGSLRAAITSVNADTTADEIDFSVAGVIQLTSGALPAITNTVKIDGSTAPGFGNLPVVEIDNNGFAGLTINASNSTLASLSIVNANGAGVTLESDDITVVGNFMGLALDGSIAANTGVGLFIDHSQHDIIGGTSPARPNYISGNGGGGIQLGTSDSAQFVQSASILGNFIGTGLLVAPSPAANQGNGITIFTDGNVIGGTQNGAPNTIAFNTGSGVVVNAAKQNAILANSIFSNTGSGIQLVNNGNQNQPAPLLTNAVNLGGHGPGFTAQISGTLSANPNTQYSVEVFATPTSTPAGQGQMYLGSQTVTTNASGIARFSLQTGLTSADVTFTATATNSSTNDTSAFSNSISFGGTQNSVFIASAYALLLNRASDASASFWVDGLNSGTFTPVTAVLGIEGSQEYITDQVDALYLRYLDRAADPQGQQYWVGVVQGGGTFEGVAEGLTSSQEYFALQGNTDPGFITGLYHDVLNRNPNAAEIAGWEAALTTGTSRFSVSTAFLTSQEYRTDLVQADYMTFLQRSADDGGLAAFVNALNAGATDQQVLAQIFGSPEGYQLWS